MLEAIILAAGKGTRMRSNLPKVMHKLAGRPLLQHVIDTALQLPLERMHLVLGHGAELIQRQIKHERLQVVLQAEQLGTGHAVMQALPGLDDHATVLILYGDVPLISAVTLQALLQLAYPGSLALLTVNLPDPNGYGRILRDASGQVEAIIEQKDASAPQLAITEVNTGILAVSAAFLREYLPCLRNDNAQQEYYLTDLIGLARKAGLTIHTLETPNLYEVQGINTHQQQAELERLYQQLQARTLMEAGLTLMDPLRFDCRGQLSMGADCVVDINCIFEGTVSLGNNVSVGPNCLIKNAVIADDVEILANTVIEDAVVGKGCHLGPFARIRPGSHFAEGVRVGNFVETKKAVVGPGSKINHLSYAGDTTIGANVNIGAGTITCNYDGVNKHQTWIEDDVFVGSNTALVAPVTIGSGATIAAGSTITQNVESSQLAVARQRQRNLDGWKRPKK